jgi:hypothetical protein
MYHPLLLPEFQEERAQKFGDRVCGPVTELFEKAVEVEG